MHHYVLTGCQDFPDGTTIPITNPNFIHRVDGQTQSDPRQAFCGSGSDLTFQHGASIYVIHDVIPFSLVDFSFELYGAQDVDVTLQLTNYNALRTYKLVNLRRK